MNVFIHELKVNFRPALVWAAALSLVGLFMLFLFPAFTADVQPLVAMLKSYPESALRALGIDAQSINSFNGFYSILIVYTILCAAIEGLTFGISVISKEGARKTSDFLFSKPISRQKILMGKYLAVFALMLMGSACYALTTLLGARTFVNDLDMRTFWLFTGAFALTQWFCLSIGFCVGCCVRRIKSPNAVGIGMGALMFALLMVDNLSDGRSISFFSPLSYLHPRYIAAHRAYEMRYFWALIVLSVLLVLAGVIRYKTRDIHSA